MTQVIVQRMWQRRDTAAAWTAANPVLASGEIGIELGALATDPQKMKLGNGLTAWNALAYFAGGGGTVWRVGSGVPDGGLGNDGDFYLNSDNGHVYQKNAGAWLMVANITGPPGDPGPPGANSTVPGPPGDPGPPGADSTVPGPPGPAVEFNVSATHIQYRYVGDVTWIDMIALADLEGDPGADSTVPGPAGGPSPVGFIGSNTTLDHAAHANKWYEVTNGVEIKLPVTAGWSTGDYVELCQSDGSPFTVVADTGASIAPFTALLIATSRYQGGAIVAKVIGTNTWRVGGAMADAP